VCALKGGSPPDPVRQALAATKESKKVEFKREFSAEQPGAWCELIKDIAAMANSSGGVIVIGLENFRSRELDP